jgi:hypothetical protein
MSVSVGCAVFPDRKHNKILKICIPFDCMSLLSIVSGKCNHVALIFLFLFIFFFFVQICV